MHSINEAMRALHTTATFIIFVYFGFSVSREETETDSRVAFRGWKSGREEQQLLILSLSALVIQSLYFMAKLFVWY